MISSTCVASGVWGTCLVSGTPSTAWSSVQQKLSANVVEWDMKVRGRGVVGGTVGPALWCLSWMWSLELAWPQIKQKFSANVVGQYLESKGGVSSRAVGWVLWSDS